MGSENEHTVMLPLMAHGHLIPFLALAKQIHRSTGFKITIANTPLNIQYLQNTISCANPNSPEKFNVNLVELPFCSLDHDLPPNTENRELTPLYNLLMDIKEKEGKPPICIITGTFFGWAVDVAKSAGTTNVTFITGGAYGTLAYTSMWFNLPHRKTNSDEFTLPGFPERCHFHITQLHKYWRMADGSDDWSKFMQPNITQSFQSYEMLCKTAEDIEPGALQWPRNYTKLPVWTIGPLLPQSYLKKSSSSSPSVNPEKIIEWLDLHHPGSVLYISFGSQNTISSSQTMELAIGLEASAKSFLWVIRPPVGFDLRGEFRSERLPEGFEERIEETKQGLLVRNWAPQLEILSHKSTGAFLSYCGWNSALESLSQGLPMIGWPIAAEQTYNSKMLVEEMGMAVELTRGVQSTIVGHDVKNVIEMVMDEAGKGQEMKAKAEKIGRQIRHQ
ncbi:UDP-glycosyltransferase 92A1 [Citrus sinensis]|uniref:UDP-glycosyltransferase 92A1 n=1 Tax=Citrus sinensis TaxID=2711 RepID=A0ACB8JJZ5_CITSI|nr:UDP-glycosyltransferase 92A1 [Citrus sinensis]